MTPAVKPDFSDRGHALLRTFRAAFEALEEHKKLYPSEHAEIMSACAAHVRSSAPLALQQPAELELPPTPRAETAIRVALGERSFYEVERDGDHIRLYLVENEAHDAAVPLNELQVIRLRHDLASVASVS